MSQACLSPMLRTSPTYLPPVGHRKMRRIPRNKFEPFTTRSKSVRCSATDFSRYSSDAKKFRPLLLVTNKNVAEKCAVALEAKQYKQLSCWYFLTVSQIVFRERWRRTFLVSASVFLRSAADEKTFAGLFTPLS